MIDYDHLNTSRTSVLRTHYYETDHDAHRWVAFIHLLVWGVGHKMFHGKAPTCDEAREKAFLAALEYVQDFVSS